MKDDRPWEHLETLLDKDATEDIKEFIDGLKTGDVNGVMSHLDREDRLKMMSLLNPNDAADIIDDIPWAQALKILEELNTSDAAAIITEMRSDDQADFLHEMEDADAEAIMTEMDQEEADKVRKLIQYDTDTAGGLMITEFLAFDENKTVKDVVTQLSENAAEYEKYNLQYIYVTSHDKFVGVLNTRNLLLSKPNTLLTSIVLRDALTVRDNDTIDELIGVFDRYDFYGVPVLTETQALVGVVLRKHVREEQADRSNVEHLETQGIVGGEEFRTMPVLLRSRRRLSWLSVNILLNIVAASVIAFYQETLSAVIALAVFLPIISDMSGCSGNQAVAVSLRELSLGVVKPFEIFRVWWQEVSVGIINGLVLGTLIGFAAWLWKGNVYLGMVVGGSLAINTVIAVSLGGTIPLFLKRMNVDPALASGPILTTVTDMVGFFLALSFAAMMLSRL